MIQYSFKIKCKICKNRKTHIELYIDITDQTTVATITWGVFFKGARIGSPNNPLHSIPLAKTTSIVDSQHDRGCLRENASAPL